jgi:hypothetical protein
MALKIMTDEESGLFEAMAHSLLNSGTAPTMVRVRLGERFGLTVKQVQNALRRVDIRLTDFTVARRGLRDMTKKEQTELVEMARLLSVKGIKHDEIRSKVAAKYNVHERSVAVRCLKSGLDIRSEFAIANEKKFKKDPVTVLDLAESDVGIKRNLFAIAAERVPGGKYDILTGNCFVGKTPISGNGLVKMAGMEFPA